MKNLLIIRLFIFLYNHIHVMQTLILICTLICRPYVFAMCTSLQISVPYGILIVLHNKFMLRYLLPIQVKRVLITTPNRRSLFDGV